MTDQLALAARRHAHAVPGHLLVAAEPCAIPASVLTVDILAERASELGVAERYTLRAISLGLDRIEEISWFLGFEYADAAAVIGSLLQLEMIDYRASSDTDQRRIQLLPAGRDAVEGVVATAPKVVTVPIMFDRIARKPVGWTKKSLTRESDIKTRADLLRLYPASGEPVSIDELTAANLSPILSDKNNVNRVLGTLGVTENRKFYKEAILLIYKGNDSDSIRLGVDIDGSWSSTHELVLERIGAVERLGIKIDEPQSPAAGGLPADVPGEVKRMGRDEVLALQTLANSSEPLEVGNDTESDAFVEATQAVESASVRWLGTYEHPIILDEAVTKSRRRVLIISPWITGAVVTKTWIRQIEKLAARVPVTIAWGYEDNPKIDNALADLHAVARRSNKLAVVRLKNTHAKVLVGDDFYVTTSFNWLSFRGVTSRRYRMEEGTLIRDRDLADQAYERYLDQIRQQAVEVIGTLAGPKETSIPHTSPSTTPAKKTADFRSGKSEGGETWVYSVAETAFDSRDRNLVAVPGWHCLSRQSQNLY